MLKYPNMRNELRYYLKETVSEHESLDVTCGDVSVFKSAWFSQKYAIDFILEDIDILGDAWPCIGVLLYNSDEVEAVRKVGQNFYDFYIIGENGDYRAAFQSKQWQGSYEAAKSALALVSANDAHPPM